LFYGHLHLHNCHSFHSIQNLAMNSIEKWCQVYWQLRHWLINDNGEIRIFGIQTSQKWQPLDLKEFKSWWMWFFNMIFTWCKKYTWGKKGNSWFPLLPSLNLNTTILYNIMCLCYHDYNFRFLCDHLYVLMMFIIAICYVIFLPLDFLWYSFVIDIL